MAVTEQDKLATIIAGESTGGGPKRIAVDDDGKTKLAEGTTIIGKVGIDQTTPGATNGVVVNSSALPAGASTAARQDTGNASVASLDDKVGEVQASPTANTLLARLKELLTDAVIAKVWHPFGKGNLTLDGLQYSAEKTTSTNDYEAVETVTCYNPTGVAIEELEFGLTMAIKSSGSAEAVKWKWQGSDDGATWVDLIAEQTRAASAAAYLDVTVAGRFAPVANFLGTGATFQVRAVIKSGGAGGETAVGKTKNSSYVYAHYRRA